MIRSARLPVRLCALLACGPLCSALPSAAQSGTGLTGQYFDTAAFGTLKTTRTDATIQFDWGTGIPTGTAITSADTFSVAWSGQIEPEFSQLYTFYVTADDGARLWVNDQLLVTRTFAAATPEMRGQVNLIAGQRVNLRLEYLEASGSARVKLEWSSASRAREIVPVTRLYPTREDKAGGSLLKEHWSGLAGGTLAALTSNANYPNKPGGREFITSFECLDRDWADSYGTRVTGYLVPPVTGSYTFAVSGDDVVELYLSTDATSANKTKIASVTAATGYRVWNAQPSQQSTARLLTQGQRYYVELLHKENTGTDHWSVGWMKPGDVSFSVVPGSALAQPGLTTAQPAETALLNTMAQEHPRLFASPERFARLKALWLSAVGSQPKTWAQSVINSANGILTAAPVAYSQDVRGTILDQSRTAKDRMYKLGLAWHLTGDSQYAERAWDELSAVAAFPDWHPAHFLDTAEMTHACAIGYDWLYQYWSPARRDTIRNAIITLGLNAGLAQYTSNAGWSRSTGNNWNMVCNGGLSMGALAVGTESESLTENILNRAINSTRPVWAHFTTDAGAWYEGPGYWAYTAEYGIRMFAALEGVLGSDFGISATRGVAEAGLAPVHALGTSNIIFNFADAGAGGASRGAVFQWMARRYGQPLYDWWNNQGGGGALEALWWNDSTASPASTGAAPDMAFRGETGTAFVPQDMVTLRGRWNDSRASYIGTKGGQMGADHGNLDGGTFVLDALGKRWFHDLGGDNYALSGYFSSTPSAGVDRWDYYRMRPEGQNTLTINPSANADMVLNAVVPLVAFQTEPGGSSSFAIHDLTPAYGGLTKVWRGTRLMGARNQMLVQDEIQSATPANVWWFAHFAMTSTTVTLDPDGSAALLQQGSERLWCKILSSGATFEIMDAVPLPTSPNPAGQNANPGHKKLAIHLPAVTATTLSVWMVPLSAGEPIPSGNLPPVTALNTWSLANANDAPTALSGVAMSNGDNAVDIDLRNYVIDDSTPSAAMRFAVSGAAQGTVALLPDGFTARFTPDPGYTGVPLFSFTARDTGLDPRVILTYDFDLPDASSALTIPDTAGLGRDGTLEVIGTGTATLPGDVPAALGRAGRSLDLAENGGANAAKVSRSIAGTELNWNTSDWTITGWFKRRDGTNEDMIWHLSSGDGYGTAEELYLMGVGADRLQLHHYPGPDVDISVTNVLPGVWRHVAVVRRGSTLSLYLDGALVGSDNTFALAIDQSAPLVFGGHSDASATYAPRWFDGNLDELAVFNAALTAGEITPLASGMTVRHFGGLSATGTISLSAAAVNHLWTNPATTGALLWTTGSHWQAGVTPVGGRGASVQFFTGQNLNGGAVTSQNDLAGTFQMNNLTLAGTSTAATSVNLTGGGFSLLNNGAQPPTVSLSGTSGSATNSLTYQVNTPVTLGADTLFNAANNGTFIFNGDIGGPGSLTRTGTASRLILAGTNSYTGDTLINSGTLQIGNDGATGSLGGGDVINAGQLRFDRTGLLEVPNSIGGTGSLYLDCPINAGTVVLRGTNTFDGGVTVNSGALRITNSTALGDGVKTITLSNGTAGAPQLRLDGSSNPIELPGNISYLTSSSSGAIISEAGDNVVSGNLSLTSGGGDTKVSCAAGTLTLEGVIAPITTGRNLQLGGAGTGFSSGVIANGNAVNILNVVKNDAGRWTLSGANTYSGTTMVGSGTLVLGHPGGLGHGGSTFGNGKGGTTVSSGATLDAGGQDGINEVITVSGTGTGGIGALVNSGSGAARIAGGLISSISTTSGGVHSTVPAVVITGGGGSGATASATLGLSAASFSLTGGTTTYSAAPVITISGGGGTGATATAVLTSGVVSGITITNAGAGYTSAPVLVFSGGTVGTAGTNPVAVGNAENFTVSGITLTAPGSGYSSVPAVAFSSGTGTVAAANLSSVILAANATFGGSGDLVLEAPVSGAFTLTKTGTGTLSLNGVNTYSGATTVNEGRLILGRSVTGSITANAAVLAPQGTPATSLNLTLAASATLQVRLNGTTAGTGYDQLTVGGTVALNGGLDPRPGPTLAPGSTFTILNKTSAGAVTGTFAGKANNSTFLAGGYTFRISYTGGDGNDIVLTLLATPIESWRHANFGSLLNSGTGADDADPDKDGVGNLVEYATSMNPNASDVIPLSATRNGNVIELTYRKNKAATDISYIVESGGNPANDWSPDGVTSTILSDNGTTQQIKATVTVPPGASRRFARLRITRP